MKTQLLVILFLFSFGGQSICFSQNKNFSGLFTILMKTTDDRFTSLNDEMGSNGIIVVFSCNTCPFVVGSESFKGWEKDYNNLYQKAKEADLGFVLLNSNEAKRDGDDSFENMQKHKIEKNYLMSYLVDKDAFIANELEAKTTPHVYIFNHNKQLIYKGSIDNTWDSSRKEDVKYLEISMIEISKNVKLTYLETEPRGCSIKRKKIN